MKLSGVLPFARELLRKSVGKDDIVLDGTVGNGHDTLFLADLVGEQGTVYSFDIQEQAIDSTRKKVVARELENVVRLIHDGHENLADHLDDNHKGSLTGAIFNLGYLPGSDKTVVTSPETTILAIKHVLANLKKEGILVLVVYYGHPEGKKEKNELLPFVLALPQEEYHVLEYGFINQKNDPPFIIAIEKR